MGVLDGKVALVTAFPLKRRSKDLSWVKGNLHAQF